MYGANWFAMKNTKKWPAQMLKVALILNLTKVAKELNVPECGKNAQSGKT